MKKLLALNTQLQLRLQQKIPNFVFFVLYINTPFLQQYLSNTYVNCFYKSIQEHVLLSHVYLKDIVFLFCMYSTDFTRKKVSFHSSHYSFLSFTKCNMKLSLTNASIPPIPYQGHHPVCPISMPESVLSFNIDGIRPVLY